MTARLPLEPVLASIATAALGVATLAPISRAQPEAFDVLDRGTLKRLATTNQRHPDVHPSDPAKTLLRLIDERLLWMAAVAQSKWILDRPVEDASRECDVLASALEAVNNFARETRMPAPSSEATLNFYSAQIEAAKALQQRWIRLRASSPRTRAIATITDTQRQQARAHLNQEIRPILLRIGERIASLVVLISASHVRPNAQIIESRLQHHELPEEHIKNLAHAIKEL